MALIRHYYRGKGWQIPVLGGCYLIGRGLIEVEFHPYIWASPLLSVLVAAAFGYWTWRRGCRLNRNAPRVEDWHRDEGFTLRRQIPHSYWFIPYQHWGIIFALLSILIDARLRARPIRPAADDMRTKEGDGELVGVQLSSPGLARSQWPSARQDSRGSSWLTDLS